VDASRAVDVLVVGSFNIDHVWRCAVLPAPGAPLAGDYASGPGGTGFNQATAAARAGARTAFACALGDDAGAAWARELSAADDIALHAEPANAPTGTAGIFVAADGSNSIVIGAGANAALSAGFVAAQVDACAGAKVVLAQLESPAGAVLVAMQHARAIGALALLNPAPANAPASRELLAAADAITPNETEFAALLATHCGIALAPDAVARTTDAELHALARRLLPHGTVLLTMGGDGLFVSHPESGRRGDAEPFYRIAAEAARVVDTTCAGDACNGALAASLALRPTLPFREHARFANDYAARSTEVAGAALAMPRLAAGAT
jgi:ribokinase